MTDQDRSSETHGDSCSERAIEDDVSAFLYVCSFIHEGYYNIRITWGEVKSLFSFAVDGELSEVLDIIEKRGYIEGYDDEDPFMILKRIDVTMKSEREERLVSAFVHELRKVPLAYNVAIVTYLQRSLMVGIIGSFYDHELAFASTARERVLVSAVTSDAFTTKKITARHLDVEISEVRKQEKNLDRYTENPWFNELLIIIKNGYYGNGGFNYIDTLESSYRLEFTSGILEIIRNGTLLWLILNFRNFVRRDRVDRAVKKFVSKNGEERSINRLYDWLSIGNDFAIGLEFLIGSVEFFPKYNPTVGIYLFIIGSTQLLIRPVISLARKVHLRALVRRKIRF